MELKVHSDKCSTCGFGMPSGDIDLPWTYTGEHATYTITQDGDRYELTCDGGWVSHSHDIYFAIAEIFREDARR